jgi:plasmid stabilization system protein ParE
MAISVNWHNDAIRDLSELIDYFESEGAIQAAFDFREKLADKIDFIAKYPGAGRPTPKRKNLRYILIDKHRRMYYRHTSKSLTILAFFDARQHPDKAPY